MNWKSREVAAAIKRVASTGLGDQLDVVIG